MGKGRSIFLATLLMLFAFSGVSQAFTYTYNYFNEQSAITTVGDTFSLDLSMDYGAAIPETNVDPLNYVTINLDFGTSGIFSVESFTPSVFFTTGETFSGQDSWNLYSEPPIGVGTENLLLGTFVFKADAVGESLITASLDVSPVETLYDVSTPSIGVAENAVPIPAAAWMLGSGLLGFGLIRRRK